MFRLTREVRFAVNLGEARPDAQLGARASNGFGGYPALNGLGIYLAARVTLRGALDPLSQYLVNIKDVDELLRGELAQLTEMIRADAAHPTALLLRLGTVCRERWGERVDSVELVTSPQQSYTLQRDEHPMLRFSQKFEFSASHRLHNPTMSDEENRKCFGKCNNPAGHGHNYELQVTLVGEPDARGVLCDVPAMERIVGETVIERLDHKNLNEEVEAFGELIPSVENIARVIFGLLKPRFDGARGGRGRLAAVTVWETPKTWCEYGE